MFPTLNRRLLYAAFLTLAVPASSPAATLYWVGSGPQFYQEARWSTSPTDSSAVPIGDPVNLTEITDDLVISSLYNGNPVAAFPGAGPVDDQSGGISDDINLSGNVVDLLDGATLRGAGQGTTLGGHNAAVVGDPADMPTLNLSGGSILSATTMSNSLFNLMDTSQLIFWSTQNDVFDGSIFNFTSTDASLRLINVPFGNDISNQLAGAGGFQFNGQSISTDDLIVSSDGEGGTLIAAAAIVPEPSTLLLITLGAALCACGAYRKRRRT